MDYTDGATTGGSAGSANDIITNPFDNPGTTGLPTSVENYE